MSTRKTKRNKNEPTAGDTLHQDWRNRQAMFRVYEAAQRYGKTGCVKRLSYWTPFDIRTMGM